MSSSLQDVPLANWQWRDPLTRFILITIIFAWGYFLELFGVLAQVTLAHMFAYIQGYFLLRRYGIPLEAIMSGEQTPFRVLSASLYASILLVYVASVGIGAYASSKLGMPYVFNTTPFKKDVAFLPVTLSLKNVLANSNLKDTNGNIKWRVESEYNNVNMQYLTAQCKANLNPPCKSNNTEIFIKRYVRLFPRVISEFPGNNPRDEHLAEILLRKDELTDLKELIDDLLEIMKKKFQLPFEEIDLISNNVMEQLVASWGCDAENVTCAQNKEALVTVQYIGTLLEAAFTMYLDNFINVDKWVGNSTSTSTLTATLKVCME
ncbi:12573_t:CDS:2, partial [Funneliformis geosporum]